MSPLVPHYGTKILPKGRLEQKNLLVNTMHSNSETHIFDDLAGLGEHAAGRLAALKGFESVTYCARKSLVKEEYM